MTGSAPVLDRPALRAALSHMQIEEPGTSRRFEQVLAERNGWSLPFAERVADEYCGFLYLAATSGFEVTPSRTVDQAWHLHLEWPHYREVLCKRILSRPLEHRPATGEPGEDERHHRQYEDTLRLYETVFSKPPPPDIWPRPVLDEEEEEEGEECREAAREQIIRRIAFASVAAGAAAAVLGAPGMGALLVGLGLILFLFGQPRAGPARDRASGSCGGGGCGGGGGGSAGSSDGCAGCGGGGCGGD